MLRIVSATLLVLLVAAGCGAAAPRHRADPPGLPRQLSRAWAAQASAVAVAARAGNDCLALRRANALQNEVIAAQAKLPSRLRSPLLNGVNKLVNRITCTPPPVTVTTPPPQPPPPKQHGNGGDNGNGNGNGGDNGNGNGNGGDNGNGNGNGGGD